jgi:MYXO-CTERM domain-containing protein
MHRLSILVLSSLLLVPGLARADVAPDVDKYMACEGLAVDAPCEVSTFRDFYTGTCQNLPCDGDPQMTCLTCVEEDPQGTAGEVGTAGASSGEGTAAGSEGTAGAPTTGALTTGGTGGSTGGSSTGASTGAASDGSTTDPGTGDSKGGCSCRSDNSGPTGGLLMLLGAVLLRRRRR